MVEAASVLLGVECERLHAALASAGWGGARLRSPFELSRAAEPCSACPDDCTLLLGWLSTVGDNEVGPARPGVHSSAEVGLLRLTCQRSSVVCSVSRAAELWPESLGCLVAVALWTYVPERRASCDGAHLEIDGELLTLLPPRTPPPPRPMRTFGVGDLVRRAPHRLLVLRGEVTAISEVSTSREADAGRGSQPDVEEEAEEAMGEAVAGAKEEAAAAAEVAASRNGQRKKRLFASASASPSQRKSGAASSTVDPYFLIELADTGTAGDGEGSGECAATVLVFSGVRACRWRHLLRAGEEYVFCNLRHGVLEGLAGQGRHPRQVLRSSGDHSRAQTRAWRAPQADTACAPRHSARARGGAAAKARRRTCCSQVLSQASQCGGYELSQGVLPETLDDDDEEEAASGPSQAWGSTPPAASLLAYEGELTRVVSPLVWELDHRFLLLLCHAPPHPRPGARPGASVLVHAAHTLPHAAATAAAPPDAQPAASGCAVAGFGLCWRGHVEILHHAPPPPSMPTKPLHSPPLPPPPLLPPRTAAATANAADADADADASVAGCVTRSLSLFLNLTEMVDYCQSLRPRWAERWRGLLSPSRQSELLLVLLGAPFKGGPRLALRESRANWREVFRHGRGCALCESRAPLPHAPPLDAILAHPRVRQAVQRAAQTSAPQLLRREALAGPGCLPPLLLGRLALGDDSDAPTLVLRDATAALPLLLSPEDARRTDCLGCFWSVTAFELLVEPPSRRGPPRVCARLRLFQPCGMLLSDTVRLLLPEAHGTVSLYSAAPYRVVSVAPRRVAATSDAPPADCGAGGQPIEPILLVPTAGVHVLGPATGGDGTRGVSFEALISSGGWRVADGSAAAPMEEARVTLRRESRRWLPLLQLGQAYLLWGGLRLFHGHHSVEAPHAELALLPLSLPPPASPLPPPPPPLGVCELLHRHAAPPPHGGYGAHRGEERTCVRCELLERRVKEEGTVSGGQSSRSLQLRLGDGRGASVEAYLDLTKVGVPPGLLVGARLRLRDVVQKTAYTTGKLYLVLDTQTEVLIEGEHTAGAAGAAGATRTAGGADATAADAADAAMAAAPPTPLGLLVQGIGRQGGIHRLHVTLRNVWSVELRWRCAGCGPFG